jgi:hypothetical protein
MSRIALRTAFIIGTAAPLPKFYVTLRFRKMSLAQKNNVPVFAVQQGRII